MPSAIKALQLGPLDFSKEYELNDSVTWFYEPDLANTEEKWFDVVILDRNISEKERTQLFHLAKAYCLFMTERILPYKNTRWIMTSKRGEVLEQTDLADFLSEGIIDYFPGSYGEKFSPNNLEIRRDFHGKVTWNGFTGVCLNGHFGEEFQQIACWKHNIPVLKGQSIDFWLEYEKSENVELCLRITQFVAGSVSTIQNVWNFDEESMRDVIYITNGEQDGRLFFSLLAKGEGNLKIGGLHDRYSRRGKGQFLPGGDRRVTSNREEVFFYFDPGDLKPPLNVYFSGYKTQEGFEGYNMLRRMGAPFLLVTESRLEGGAFYLGSDEYEQMIVGGIRQYMRRLGFSEDQVIFSGLSMGTFGAMYYGCDIKPFAVIVGKPLASLGDMADNERLRRPGGFPTSLDVLWKQYGSLDQDAVEQMNRRFWNKFDAVRWENTKFIVSYMIEDDYDESAYPMLLSHINDDRIEIFGKGLHGRHNDDTGGIVSWFISRFHHVLKENFARES